jgi:hypothetical protein
MEGAEQRAFDTPPVAQRSSVMTTLPPASAAPIVEDQGAGVRRAITPTAKRAQALECDDELLTCVNPVDKPYSVMSVRAGRGPIGGGFRHQFVISA